MILIGLTGERGVGKSEFTKYAMEFHNFGISHAFEPGKRLTMHFYVHELRIPHHIAVEMVYGSLKDIPSPYLPNNDTSRRFMEELGFCLGKKMGSEYTIGIEMDRIREDNRPGYIMDSVVYEAPFFVGRGGIIVRIEREDRDKTIQAVHTSKAQSEVPAHVILKNSGTLQDFQRDIGHTIDTILHRKSMGLEFSYNENKEIVIGGE